jgi:hypothetical protein
MMAPLKGQDDPVCVDGILEISKSKKSYGVIGVTPENLRVLIVACGMGIYPPLSVGLFRETGF